MPTIKDNEFITRVGKTKDNEFITRDAQVAIGQYLGSGGMTLVAQLCPMLKGETGNPTVHYG